MRLPQTLRRGLDFAGSLFPLLVGIGIGTWIHGNPIDSSDSTLERVLILAGTFVVVAVVVFGFALIVRDVFQVPMQYWRAFVVVVIMATVLPVAAAVMAGYAVAHPDPARWDLLKAAVYVQTVAVLNVMSWRWLSWRWFWQLALLTGGVTMLLIGGAPWTRLGLVASIAAVLLVVACNASQTTVRITSLLTLGFVAGLLARVARENPSTPGQGFLQQVSDGLGQVLTGVIRPVSGPDARVVMSPGGWIAVAVIVALIHRSLELRSGKREVGPVTVDNFTVQGDPASSTPTPEYLTRRLQNELANVSIFEPGTLPSADVGREISSVLSNDITQHGAVIASLIKLVNQLAFPATGYIVLPTYDTIGDGAKHRVSMTVKTANRGQLLFASEVTSSSLDHAMLQAAACVGEYTLARADVVPDWSAWPEDQSRPLELYLQFCHAPDESKLQFLEAAHAANPGNGVLRVQLGLQRELQGDYVAALVLYLGAVRTFNTFVLAHYRAAITLQTVAEEVARGKLHHDESWGPLAHLLPGDIVWNVDDETSRVEAARHLLLEARKLAKRTAGSVTLLATAGRALVRPDERQADLSLITRRNQRQRLARQVQIVQQMIALRELALEAHVAEIVERSFVRTRSGRLDRLTNAVEDIVSHASHASDVLRYNAACFHAVRARVYEEQRHRVAERPSWAERANEARHRAIELLWEAYRSPGTDALTYDWTSKDPDLDSLRPEPGFEQLLGRLGADNERLRQLT